MEWEADFPVPEEIRARVRVHHPPHPPWKEAAFSSKSNSTTIQWRFLASRQKNFQGTKIYVKVAGHDLLRLPGSALRTHSW